jgi:hypothetical protein
MSIPLLGAGLSAVTTLFGGFAADRAQASQIRQKAELAKKQNDFTMKETARAVAEINRQRTMVNIQTASALAYNQTATKQEAAAVDVNAALTNQIGATAAIIEADVTRRSDEQLSSIWRNNEFQQENLNQSLESLMIQQSTKFQGLGSVNVPSGGAILGQALSAGVGTYLGLGGKFKV